MPTQYKVTGACVTNVPAGTAQGTQLITLYTGQILPADVPADRIKHLLSVKLIEEVGGSDAPVEQTAPAQDSGQAGGAKTVNARSSRADLVEHGVAQGDNRSELEQLTREQLLARYVRQQQ